jgi:hypothetical protein
MVAVSPNVKATHLSAGYTQTGKSFLLLFFKKEQKERPSFLKKRSKKLLPVSSAPWLVA